MLIKHDYSYMNDKELIEKGCAELDIHSLSFDRCYTDEEKQNNSSIYDTMTSQEWNLHCEKASEEIYNQMLPIMQLLNNKYNIHQTTEETSTMEHFKSNWDLYFWSNRGWNGKSYFDNMRMSFNEKREVQQNINLLKEIISLLEELEVKNVACRIQYTIRLNEDKIKNKGMEICKNLLDTNIDYMGMKGKIKIIDKVNNIYGFVKSRVRKSYYNISDTYLILNFDV